MIIDDKDSFPLSIYSTASRFTVGKKTAGSGGLKIKKLLNKGKTVRLTVKNPDGKLSSGRDVHSLVIRFL